MEFSLWLSLVLICVLGAISPGPSLAIVLKHSIQNSTFHGIIAAVSHGLGVGFYAVITLAGLSTLILSTPTLFNFLVYGGAAYLAYMGYKALTAKPSPQQQESFKQSNDPLSKAAVQGFAIAFLNPKLAVFFAALFSQFINPESLSFERATIMVLTVFFIDTIWYLFVAGFVGVTRAKLNLSKHTSKIDKIAGVVFIALAARIVIS